MKRHGNWTLYSAPGKNEHAQVLAVPQIRSRLFIEHGDQKSHVGEVKHIFRFVIVAFQREFSEIQTKQMEMTPNQKFSSPKTQHDSHEISQKRHAIGLICQQIQLYLIFLHLWPVFHLVDLSSFRGAPRFRRRLDS